MTAVQSNIEVLKQPLSEHAMPRRAQSEFPAEHPVSSPLSIHDMTVAYHRKPVLWDVDYDAPDGKLIAIVGPNGAGKSTLIKASLDLVPRASGRVQIYGQPYRKQRSRVGYVPQRGSVDWDLNRGVLTWHLESRRSCDRSDCPSGHYDPQQTQANELVRPVQKPSERSL